MSFPTKININGCDYLIKYQKSKNLSSNIRIKNGEVIIKLSKFLFAYKKEETVMKFLSWAKKKLSHLERNDLIIPNYENGGIIQTHNKIYEVSVKFFDKKNAKGVLLNNYLIEVFLPRNLSLKERKKEIRFISEKIIIKDMQNYLYEVIDELNGMYFNVKYNNLRFKRMKSRFGSCSSKKNINIAYRLLFAPKEVFRYVCAHELAHLVYFNHSKKFWDVVSVAVSDYKNAEKWLKNNGFMLG